jgi:DNA-directed RNA polymerase specialized sigma24 family protein
VQSILPERGREGRTASVAEQRAVVAALYVQYSVRVRQVVAAGLRPADRHQAEDIAQDVWLQFWQKVLRGDTIAHPSGLLATMARRRVVDHYRSARVRREAPVDLAAPGVSLLPAARSAEDVAFNWLAGFLLGEPTPAAVPALAGELVAA